MCYTKYSISCVGLNLLIFGVCILTIATEAFIDIQNKEFDNNDNQIIYCITLIVISSILIISSLFTITKINYDLLYQDDML